VAGSSPPGAGHLSFSRLRGLCLLFSSLAIAPFPAIIPWTRLHRRLSFPAVRIPLFPLRLYGYKLDFRFR
jgi:hypothetical protein